ncbi:MAG: hypothetical protein RLZZ543_2344, partial [Bacteroidota bacterium]
TNFLYKNNGDGTFEDVSVPSGTDNGYHYTLQSIWFDYDNDSWPDLFVNNDRSVHRNYLYHNNGNGTFTEVGIQAGIGVYIDAMSASVADFNNDGWFDIYITDTPGLGNYLFRNNGNGTFTNVAAINNVTSGQFTWGAVWIDADNNKLQDLFVASMPYLPNSFPGYNSYFKNYGNIFDPQYSTGLTIDAGSTFSCARGDINNDGFPDLLTHSYAPLGTQIWQNNGGSGHFFKVGLQGVFSNEDAIGTRIELYAGGVKQFRYTFCGEQYISQNSQWQHFGLGTTTSIDSLIIRWPRGHIDAFYHLPVDETRLFVEGETLNASLVLQGATSLCEGESAQLNAGSWVSYAWSSGDTTSSITVSETGDYSAMVFNGSFYIPSDTIHIEVHPTPSVSITAQSPNCFALSNGFIQISSDTSGTVVWTDGVEGFIRNVISAGTYSFTYVSPEACEVSDELILTQPEQLHVVTEFSAELCPGTWSASVIPSGGTPPYSYNWDFYQTNETSPFLSISDSVFTCHTSSSNQTVVYTVVDANGCTVTGEQDLGYILAYAEIAATELTVFPNPVDAEVNVNAALSIDQLSVYDASGRLLLTKHHSSTCDISMLARGFYVVQLKTGGQTYYRSIMKK